MADQKISQLSSATAPLAGTEVLPIVQNGSTVKVSVANLTAGRDVGVSELTAGASLATWATLRAIKNDTAALASFSNNTYLTQNYFYNANNKYIGNGYAGIVAIDGTNGKIQFQLADNNVSGAGAVMSPVTVGEFDFATKNLTLNSGNLVISTSGKGIT